MPRIVPIRDLKNTTAISNLCHEDKEPIFITKNGYGDMVIMSMEIYEKKYVPCKCLWKIRRSKRRPEKWKLLFR